MPFVASSAYVLDALAAVIAGILNTSVPAHTTIKLAQGAFAPTPTSNPSVDFTEATYTGYAAVTVSAWTAAYLTSPTVAETIGTAIAHFSPTGTAINNVITGYWAIAGDTTYLGGEAFAPPGKTMASPSDAINIVPTWQQPPPVFSTTLVP